MNEGHAANMEALRLAHEAEMAAALEREESNLSQVSCCSRGIFKDNLEPVMICAGHAALRVRIRVEGPHAGRQLFKTAFRFQLRLRSATSTTPLLFILACHCPAGAAAAVHSRGTRQGDPGVEGSPAARAASPGRGLQHCPALVVTNLHFVLLLLQFCIAFARPASDCKAQAHKLSLMGYMPQQVGLHAFPYAFAVVILGLGCL